MRPAFLALAVAAIAACGGAPPKPAPSHAPSATSPPGQLARDCELREISLLHRELEWFARNAELPADGTCRPSPPDLRALATCRRCDLAGQICDNAADICRVAGAPALADHDWAQRKCRDARALCRRARAVATGSCTVVRPMIF
jgi:hypothetical protein